MSSGSNLKASLPAVSIGGCRDAGGLTPLVYFAPSKKRYSKETTPSAGMILSSWVP